jgi:hypothetical protein
VRRRRAPSAANRSRTLEGPLAAGHEWPAASKPRVEVGRVTKLLKV